MKTSKQVSQKECKQVRLLGFLNLLWHKEQFSISSAKALSPFVGVLKRGSVSLNVSPTFIGLDPADNIFD